MNGSEPDPERNRRKNNSINTKYLKIYLLKINVSFVSSKKAGTSKCLLRYWNYNMLYYWEREIKKERGRERVCVCVCACVCVRVCVIRKKGGSESKEINDDETAGIATEGKKCKSLFFNPNLT